MKNFVYKVQQGNYKMSLLHDKSVPFIFSFNRKYQKQLQNIIPFLSSCCPFQLQVAQPF